MAFGDGIGRPGIRIDDQAKNRSMDPPIIFVGGAPC